MKIIGLSGGIASGKNFVAEVFAKKGAVIFDADKEVHELFNNHKGLISNLAKVFPEAVIDNKINRKILGRIVFSNQDKLQILENLIHPLVRKNYNDFLQKAKNNNKKLALLNIPLLLEKGGYKCDKIIALLINPSIQKRRFLQRQKKNNPEKSLQQNVENFNQIISFQLTNKQRKEKADFILRTDSSKKETLKQLQEILKKL